MTIVSIKSGGLITLVARIQHLQKICPPDWKGRLLLTKLLLSLANVNHIVQHFNLGTLNSGARVSSSHSSRSSSPTNLDSPRFEPGITPSFSYNIAPSSPSHLSPNLSIPLTEQTGEDDGQQNIFIELDLNGVISYVSPTSIEILK